MSDTLFAPADLAPCRRPTPEPVPPGAGTRLVGVVEPGAPPALIADGASHAAEKLRNRKVPCTIEGIGRAVRSGERYAGLLWTRERAPKGATE